jgi:hypothetical protein
MVGAKKITVTLSDDVDGMLRALSGEHDANHSVIAEAALMSFFTVPPAERDYLIRYVHSSKKAYTRARWRAAFWDAMFDEFWLARRLRGGRRTDFTPLTFAGFQVWFLGSGTMRDPDPEDAPVFHVQIMASPLEMRLQPSDAQRQFVFRRSRSPYEAAREVADFIRARVVPLGILETVALPGGGNALLDYAGPHWMPELDIEPKDLPVRVTGKMGAYLLDRDYILRRLPRE